MHVLMTGDAVGGVWTYVLDLARNLGVRGVTVTVAILGPRPSPVQYESAGGLHIVAMEWPLDWTAASPSDVLEACASLARYAASIKADIVHLHSAALAAGGAYAMPVVVVCHSCIATWWEACGAGSLPADLAWRRDLAAKGARRADALVAPTVAFAADTMRVYNLREMPIVIYNGRRPRRELGRQSARLAASALPSASDVFAAGRLWDRAKGMDDLDRVAALLSTPVDAAGSTVGPNGEQGTFQNLNLLGQLDEETMAACLAAQPVFVSLARYEPFGLTVLEAAQAGCALVLADIASFRELWEGVALFVDPGDAFAVSQVIETVLHHTDGRDRFGAQARARSARYTIDAMTDSVLAVFRDLLASAQRTTCAPVIGGVA